MQISVTTQRSPSHVSEPPSFLFCDPVFLPPFDRFNGLMTEADFPIERCFASRCERLIDLPA